MTYRMEPDDEMYRWDCEDAAADYDPDDDDYDPDDPEGYGTPDGAPWSDHY